MTSYNKEFWASVIALGAAVLFCVASFWNTDAEVYLFPRIIAILLLVLAIMQSITTFRNSSKTAEIKQAYIAWRGLIPGLIVSIAYVISIEFIGFYVGALLAFIILVSLYGKRSAMDAKAMALKLAIGLLLVCVLYGLFWHLLNVRTPTGWFL